MKRNALLDECRQRFITPEIRRQVDICVYISNCIYDILKKKNMSQRDLAILLGKTEAEISRILSGTHNITTATIAKIEIALGEKIILTDEKSNKSQFIFACTEDFVMP